MRGVLALILWALSLPAAADPKSDCTDPGPWKRLDGLIEKYKGTDGESDVLYLRDLRIFVCTQIELGHLPQPAGSALFDREKQRIVEEWARDGEPQAL